MVLIAYGPLKYIKRLEAVAQILCKLIDLSVLNLFSEKNGVHFKKFAN
jgi:hypothetical protein